MIKVSYKGGHFVAIQAGFKKHYWTIAWLYHSYGGKACQRIWLYSTKEAK